MRRTLAVLQTCNNSLRHSFLSGIPGSFEFRHRRELLLQNVHELGGRKTLYAPNYYTEEEFWNVYDRRRYDAVRERYHASWLPSVYDKIIVDEDAKQRAIDASRLPNRLRNVRPIQGFYGVYKAWRGGDYLLQSKKAPKKTTTKEG